jgi:phospholipase A-2-activating protein
MAGAADVMDIEPFTLSATLAGHEQDVRAVASLADGAVLTSSRDATVRVWRRGGDAGVFGEGAKLEGHSHFVIAVCATATGAASGSNDKHVIEWDLSSGAPARILEGHGNTVSAVSYSHATGCLLSASWGTPDTPATAKVWKDGACVATLKGHKATIWAVLPVEDEQGHVITASGDRTCKLWRGEECVRTFEGHTDAVRALALLPGVGFLSASNDGTVKLWELGGTMLHSLDAHQSFIYSVSVLPSGEWVTASEDRTLCVWQSGGGEIVQRMAHPSTVWSTTALPNGDLVAGCADGNAYVWTRAPARACAEGDFAAFKEAVASVAVPAQQAGADGTAGIDPSMIKDEEALKQPGRKEGENLIVKEGGKTMLYQWSMASASWEKVGEVTGSAGGDGSEGATLGKRWYQGKEYDYLFDIDINNKPLQLPFNRGDDPWMTAQRWMWDNEIDQDHLNSIAEHIMANTPDNQVVNTSAAGADPLTGGSRYIPGSANPAGLTQGNNRPFVPEGGIVAGGYEASQRAAALAAAGGAGGSGSSSSSAAARSVFALFDTCKHDAVLGKLMQFNADPAAGALALSEAEAARLSKLVGVFKGQNGGAGAPVDKEDVALFLGGGGKGADGLLAWPMALLFPCVDLLRLLILHPKATPLIAGAEPAAVPRLLSLLSAAQAASADSKPAGAAALMLLRCLANMASRTELRDAVAASASEQLDALSSPLEAGPAPARLAACSVLYNLTCVDWKAAPADASLRSEAFALQAVSLLSHALTNVPGLREPAEEESLHRLLLALHNLLGGGSGAGAMPGAAEAAKDLELAAALKGLSLPNGKLSALGARIAAQLA